MATRKSKLQNEVQAKDVSAALRKHLEAKIGQIPEDVLFEFGAGPKAIEDIQLGHTLTDWPDSFDRNSWYKTWAKSGALAERSVRPAEYIAARARVTAKR